MTGRPAQFGRSLLPEVSGKLIAQFASNLEALIASDNAPAAEETAAPESDGTAADSSGEAATAAAKPAPAPVMKQEESLNAFKFVVVPVLKRVIPVAAVGAAIAVVIRKANPQEEVVLADRLSAMWPLCPQRGRRGHDAGTGATCVSQPPPAGDYGTRTSVIGRDESAGSASVDGGRPAATTEAPRAATIAPLSVHRPGRGTRT